MREPVALLGGRSLTNQKHGTPSRFPRGGSVVTQFEKMTAWRRSIPQQKKLGASGSSAYACYPRCEQGIVAWFGTHPMCGG